jgi:hypothetical protein
MQIEELEMADNTFPADYPKRESLAKSGMTTRAQVREASDDVLAKRAGISVADVGAIREYETAHPEATQTPPASGASEGSGADKSEAGTSGKGASPGAMKSQTAASEAVEKLSFSEAYIFRGTTYGPGENLEVPKAFADTLRARNLVGDNGRVLSQSPVGATLAPIPNFVAPDQNFASEQLATGFPGRELLISKGVTTRSELTRMSDVDLLNVGASRELIGQIREALRMTQPVR